MRQPLGRLGRAQESAASSSGSDDGDALGHEGLRAAAASSGEWLPMGGSLHSFPSCSHLPAHAQPEEAQKRCRTKGGAEGMTPTAPRCRGDGVSLQLHLLTLILVLALKEIGSLRPGSAGWRLSG